MRRESALICHVIYRLDYGGLENGLVNLVNHLPRERFRHAIVCLAGAGAMRERIEREDVRVVSIDKRAGKDPASYARAWRVFRALQPDIVHTRNLGTIDLQWVAWAAGIRRRLHGEHGWDASDPRGDARRTRSIRRACRPVIQRYVAMSRDIERWLRDDIGVAAARIRQVYNGVDTRRFHPGNALPQDWPWTGEDRRNLWVCGTVGRLDPLKNQVALVDAFADVVARSPGERNRLRLVVAGDGPARGAIETRIRERGLGKLAWVAGARRDVQQVLTALDVFALPSINEGISNTILEAMATGLPVVAASVGGNAEVVENDRSGILCADSAPSAIADALARYLADPALAQRHGTAGRARAEQHFSLEAMVREYSALYDEVLARPEAVSASRGTEVRH